MKQIKEEIVETKVVIIIRMIIIIIIDFYLILTLLFNFFNNVRLSRNSTLKPNIRLLAVCAWFYKMVLNTVTLLLEDVFKDYYILLDKQNKTESTALISLVALNS